MEKLGKVTEILSPPRKRRLFCNFSLMFSGVTESNFSAIFPLFNPRPKHGFLPGVVQRPCRTMVFKVLANYRQ